MRIINHDTHTGPGDLRLRLPVGSVTVTASATTTQTSVTLTPAQAGDQAAIDAIEQTRVSQAGDMLAITVPPTSDAGSGVTQTVVHYGDGSVYVRQSAGVITGEFTGVTINDDGSMVFGSVSGSTSAGGGAVLAEVQVPAGQHVEIDTSCADVTATGPLAFARVKTHSGNVRVDQADAADLEAGSGDLTLGRTGDVRARTGSGNVRIDYLHTGTVRTGRGDIAVEAATGSAELVTNSGKVRIDHLNTGTIRSGSGDVTARTITGHLALNTGSGNVRIGQAHTGTIRTGHGDITVQAITGSLALNTGSGNVRAHLAAEVPLKAKTGSGDIRVTAEPGIRVDRSGLKTGSGDIRTPSC